jgi:hypothetical protein
MELKFVGKDLIRGADGQGIDYYLFLLKST